MDNIWLLLLLAGLVVGVAFIGGNYIGGTRTVPPERPETERDQQVRPESERQDHVESETEAIGDVDSLDFTVEEVTDRGETTLRFRVNRPGTEQEDVRIDINRHDGSEAAFILRHGKNEGWVKDYSSEQWAHFSGYAFTQFAGTRARDYSVYRVTDWKAMEGETSRVDTQHGTARVYDVRVNRSIPESVFVPD